eukprot:COSAG01_NODE_257_length_20101_cov_142.726427_12_plen_101_part_00
MPASREDADEGAPPPPPLLTRRYATFVEGIAGGDATDHRATAAGLPPVDSVNHWDFLSGKTRVSPRSAIPLGSCTAVSRAFLSCTRSILTEIYLCHARSC